MALKKSIALTTAFNFILSPVYVPHISECRRSEWETVACKKSQSHSHCQCTDSTFRNENHMNVSAYSFIWIIRYHVIIARCSNKLGQNSVWASKQRNRLIAAAVSAYLCVCVWNMWRVRVVQQASLTLSHSRCSCFSVYFPIVWKTRQRVKSQPDSDENEHSRNVCKLDVRWWCSSWETNTHTHTQNECQ